MDTFIDLPDLDFDPDPGPQTAAQRTEEWLRERLGHITGSRMVDVLGTPHARGVYGMELIAERLTGVVEPEINTPSLEWGRKCEPFAKQVYVKQKGGIITEAGFVKHRTLAWVGASPDGLLDPQGGLEVKSPYNSTVQLNTWRNGMPAEHKPQVQCNLWVNEREWWDFVSFDPRMPPHLQLYVQRIYRDEPYIKQMAEASERLLAEIEVELQRINRLGMAAYTPGEPA